MIFTVDAVNHIFNVPCGGLICEFLLIGTGGGEGTYDKGGGCGAGGVHVTTNNITLNNGTKAARGYNGFNNEHRLAMLGNPGWHNNCVKGYGWGGGGIGSYGNDANHPTNPSRGGNGKICYRY